jgi:hypothetical protein
MAEIIQSKKDVTDANVQLTGTSNRITVTSESSVLKLAESEQSNAVVHSTGDLDFKDNADGSVTLRGRGSNTSPNIILTDYLGSPITEIADGAFVNDRTLESITIPATVKRIGKQAFANSALAQVTFEDSDKVIIFCEKPTDWDTLCLNYTYTDNGEEKSSVWPGDVMTCWDADKNIYYHAVPSTAGVMYFNNGLQFSDTNSKSAPAPHLYNNILYKIHELRDGYIALGSYYAPQNFDLHESLTIDTEAFRSCGLTSVELPGRTTYIKDSAFRWCASCTNISFTDNSRLVNIGSTAFSGCAMSSLYLPEGLATMGVNVFKDCQNLNNVSLPSTLKTLPLYTFEACSSLASVELRSKGESSQPQGCNTIQSYAFRNCRALREITIPSSVSVIQASAFEGCPLDYVYFEEPYTWFVSKNNSPETTEATLVKPDVIKWTDNDKLGAAYAACLLRDGYVTGRPNHNETDLQHYHVPDTAPDYYLHLYNNETITLVSGYMDWNWYRRTKMPAPKLSLNGDILTMKDPLGVAEWFWIYVDTGNGPERRCKVLAGATASEE